MAHRTESFDPHAYTITVRRALVDDEVQYVGRVAELASVLVLEDTPSAAYEQVSDVIVALREAAIEDGRPFPPPLAEARLQEAPGRFTLRMPPWLHMRLQAAAEGENESLNSHICAILTAHQTVESVIAAGITQSVAMQMRPTKYVGGTAVLQVAETDVGMAAEYWTSAAARQVAIVRRKP